jgi:DNA invertase Pin-like site-specific DNA recombinase
MDDHSSNKVVALYARTSTLLQDTGLESQVRVLRQYCDQNDIKDVQLFSDNGISGTKSSRPALDQMMAAVERGEISSVVVHSFSRFARSTTHLLNALTIFKNKGVHFVSISERIDTNSAVGVAIFSILAAIAQLERDLIASRVKIGLENARAKGRQIGRKKLRDSDLIRKLLKSGLTYRQISSIAKTSHGSVHQEKLAMKRDEEAARKKALELAAKEKAAAEDSTVSFPEISKEE